MLVVDVAIHMHVRIILTADGYVESRYAYKRDVPEEGASTRLLISILGEDHVCA